MKMNMKILYGTLLFTVATIDAMQSLTTKLNTKVKISDKDPNCRFLKISTGGQKVNDDPNTEEQKVNDDPNTEEQKVNDDPNTEGQKVNDDPNKDVKSRVQKIKRELIADEDFAKKLQETWKSCNKIVGVDRNDNFSPEQLIKNAEKISIQQKHYDYDMNEKLLVICRAMFAHYNALQELKNAVKNIDDLHLYVEVKTKKGDVIKYNEKAVPAIAERWMKGGFLGLRKKEVTIAQRYLGALKHPWIRARFTKQDKEKVVNLLQKRVNKVKSILRAFCHQRLFKDDIAYISKGAKVMAACMFAAKMCATLVLGVAPFFKRIPIWDDTGVEHKYVPMKKRNQILFQVGNCIGQVGLKVYEEWDDLVAPHNVNDYDDQESTVMDKSVIGPRFHPEKGLEKLIGDLEASMRRCQTNELNDNERAKQWKTARFVEKLIMYERTLPKKGLKIIERDLLAAKELNNMFFAKQWCKETRVAAKSENYVKRFVFVANPPSGTTVTVHKEVMKEAIYETGMFYDYIAMRRDADSTHNDGTKAIVGVLQLPEFMQVWLTRTEQVKGCWTKTAHLKKFFKVFLNKNYDITIYDITPPKEESKLLVGGKAELLSTHETLPKGTVVTVVKELAGNSTKVKGSGVDGVDCTFVIVNSNLKPVTHHMPTKRWQEVPVINELLPKADGVPKIDTVHNVNDLETTEWAQKLAIANFVHDLKQKEISTEEFEKQLEEFKQNLEAKISKVDTIRKIETSEKPIKDAYENKLRGIEFHLSKVKECLYNKFNFQGIQQNVEAAQGVEKWLETFGLNQCETPEEFDELYNFEMDKRFEEVKNNYLETATSLNPKGIEGTNLAIQVAMLYWRLTFEKLASEILSKSLNFDKPQMQLAMPTVQRNYGRRAGIVGALTSLVRDHVIGFAGDREKKETLWSFHNVKRLATSTKDYIKLNDDDEAIEQRIYGLKLVQPLLAKMDEVGQLATKLEKMEENPVLYRKGEYKLPMNLLPKKKQTPELLNNLRGVVDDETRYVEFGAIDTSDDEPVFLSLSKACELTKFVRPLLHKVDFTPQFMCVAGESLVRTYSIIQTKEQASDNKSEIDELKAKVHHLEELLTRGSAASSPAFSTTSTNSSDTMGSLSSQITNPRPEGQQPNKSDKKLRRRYTRPKGKRMRTTPPAFSGHQEITVQEITVPKAARDAKERNESQELKRNESRPAKLN